VLTARAFRDEMKGIARMKSLPLNYSGVHSFRKGGIIYMRAQGATEDDRRERGNYMNASYDCVTGLGVSRILISVQIKIKFVKRKEMIIMLTLQPSRKHNLTQNMKLNRRRLFELYYDRRRRINISLQFSWIR
jgi:hypothetical protein